MVDLGAVLIGSAAAFVVFAIVGLYRVYAGPTAPDRVIATNVVGTNTVIVIALLAAAFDQPLYLDIALVYGLLNFLLAIAFSKFSVERGEVL
ncbi:MAG: cation:proton antiporter [Halapricum sp.]